MVRTRLDFHPIQMAYETAIAINSFVALERINTTICITIKIFSTATPRRKPMYDYFQPYFDSIRSDPIDCTRFKLNQRQLWQYNHIWRWMGDMMRLPGMEKVRDDEYLQHCKQGYFGRTGNGTIPVGPLGYPKCYLHQHPSQQYK
jgi:glutathionyl-hydroquinone reductase